MKSILVYGIAATFMAYAVMAGEKRVSRSVSASDKSGTHVVASTNATAKAFARVSASATTNATAKASSHSSSSDSKKSEQTKTVKNQQAMRK